MQLTDACVWVSEEIALHTNFSDSWLCGEPYHLKGLWLPGKH